MHEHTCVCACVSYMRVRACVCVCPHMRSRARMHAWSHVRTHDCMFPWLCVRVSISVLTCRDNLRCACPVISRFPAIPMNEIFRNHCDSIEMIIPAQSDHLICRTRHKLWAEGHSWPRAMTPKCVNTIGNSLTFYQDACAQPLMHTQTFDVVLQDFG